MAGWKRFVSLLLVLVIVGGTVSPVMAVEIDSQEFKQQKLNFILAKVSLGKLAAQGFWI